MVIFQRAILAKAISGLLRLMLGTAVLLSVSIFSTKVYSATAGAPSVQLASLFEQPVDNADADSIPPGYRQPATGTAPELASRWQRLYGDTIEFVVLRNGREVGHYRTEFDYRGRQLRVASTMELQVRWLLWRYRYSYRADEYWRDDQLQGLRAEIDDDGEITRFEFERRGQSLIDQQGEQLPLPVLASHHYNIAVLQQGQVLNTLTGRLNRFEVDDLGMEVLALVDGELQARRYRYRGELHDTEVWYDNDGRWVGLRFNDPRGAQLEFRCRSCKADSRTQLGGNLPMSIEDALQGARKWVL